MGELNQEVNKPEIFENFMAKKDCRIKIVGAEPHNWKPKDATGITKETLGIKVQIMVTDPDVVCENSDASPSRTINDFINIVKHPFMKGGEVIYMRPGKLYQLEAAFGFEPVYVDECGSNVEPKVSKTGKRYCPKGASQKFNPDFIEAYFDDEDKPRFDAWLEKDLVADVGVQPSQDEEYGPRNVIKSYKAQT